MTTNVEQIDLSQIEMQADTRLCYLMKINGFDILIGEDEFGYVFTGSNLDGRSISVKWIDRECFGVTMPTRTRRGFRNFIHKNMEYFDFQYNGTLIVLDDQQIAGAFVGEIYRRFLRANRDRSRRLAKLRSPQVSN